MKEKHWGRITVALGRTPLEITISSMNLLLGYHLKWPIHPKTYSSDLRLSFDCVSSSSDKLLASNNCCKTHHQPNSFTHSLTNLLYWAYWAHPLFLSGFGLRFVTLQNELWTPLFFGCINIPCLFIKHFCFFLVFAF